MTTGARRTSQATEGRSGLRAPPPRRFHVLLALLCSLFVLQPVADVRVLGVRLGGLLTVLVLAGCVSALRGRRIMHPVSVLLAVVGVVVTTLSAVYEELRPLVLTSDALMMTLLFLVCGCIVVELFATRRVGLHSISAALSIYLLIGLAFAFLYDMIEHLEPGSFSNLVESARAGGARLGGLMYFSFVTLTTLGYGDMAPQTPVACNFAVSEALLGQVVLVVLVARLVGMEVAAAQATAADDDDAG